MVASQTKFLSGRPVDAQRDAGIGLWLAGHPMGVSQSLNRQVSPLPSRRDPRPRLLNLTGPTFLETDAPVFDRFRYVPRPTRRRLRQISPMC